jgi:hypothetical protein
MPNGALAPGNVLPLFCVPTNGRTRSTGSGSAARAEPGSHTSEARSSGTAARSRRIIDEPPVNGVIVR